jgi:hypothetical protein
MLAWRKLGEFNQPAEISITGSAPAAMLGGQVPVAAGGTGANTVAAARTNLQAQKAISGGAVGKFAKFDVGVNDFVGVTPDASEIPTGIFPITQGGTGAGTAAAARANLSAAKSGVNNDISELGLVAGIRILAGAGTPEGSVAANVGSLYLRTDGGALTTLYIKESGAGATGWVAK